MADAVRDDVRGILDNLSGDELLAARRYLEGVLHARGIDPYAHLDTGDDLDEAERARRHGSIERGLREMKAGQGIPAQDVLEELRRAR